MKSTNPVLKDNIFKVATPLEHTEGSMTMQGTINKSLLLLSLSLITAIWTWNKFFVYRDLSSIMPMMNIGVFGGFICAIIITFNVKLVSKLAPVYALLEGLFIGGVSSFFELRYPGIAFQAASLTFGTLGIMLLLYKYRIVNVTEKFKVGIMSAMGAICMVYFISFILSFFGVSLGFIHGSGPIGILFSFVVVGVAAFSLLLDFDMIERGQISGAPKFMEWYGAFALMVSMIWLYMNILTLLAKLRDRNR